MPTTHHLNDIQSAKIVVLADQNSHILMIFKALNYKPTGLMWPTRIITHLEIQVISADKWAKLYKQSKNKFISIF